MFKNPTLSLVLFEVAAAAAALIVETLSITIIPSNIVNCLYAMQSRERHELSVFLQLLFQFSGQGME